MSSRIGLYFPYLQFPSDKWVKVSALYWDKMYRISPRGHPFDSEVVNKFHHLNYIDTIQPIDDHAALWVLDKEF